MHGAENERAFALAGDVTYRRREKPGSNDRENGLKQKEQLQQQRFALIHKAAAILYRH